MFRTGPIRNFAPSEVTVVACVLTDETIYPVRHEVTFSIVQLDGEPVTIHSENAILPAGRLGTFEVALPQTVRTWEVRVEADPDFVLLTVYHQIDGKLEPSMTYHNNELYYLDILDERDNSSFLFSNADEPLEEDVESPLDWLHIDENDEFDR